VKPTAAQVHQALLNFYRPLRTNGSKVKDALDHVKTSTKESPGTHGIGFARFATAGGCTSLAPGLPGWQ
jgi:hypothetical protein